jgi:hypothetical protein
VTGWQIALIVGLFVAIDLAVIGTVFSMVGATLRPLVSAFPPVPPAPDAVRRRFQSFRFDMLNFGGCIHVAADERCLHLFPSWLARRFGMRDMSVPWSELQRTGGKGKWVEVKLRGVTIRGPAWCMNLAAPAENT